MNRRCSTPVGVKGISTRCHDRPYGPRYECSTPVGVKGISTRPSATCGVLVRACSTPVGVKGISTDYFSDFGLTRKPGAQRLSASKESPRVTSVRAEPQVCVLNACRRQRNLHDRQVGFDNALGHGCSTPVGVKGISTMNGELVGPRRPACAQRLSASKESPRSGDSLRSRRPRTGAQRLSASRNLHLPKPCEPLSTAADVLNACRRQGISICWWPATWPCLACAQRLSASKESPPGDRPPSPGPGSGAQRLSASKESPRQSHVSNENYPPVLNACRRQSNFHVSPRCRSAHSFASAQRLSASKDISTMQLVKWSILCVSCSTPVGVKAISPDTTARRRSATWMCSTPVGVKAILRGTNGIAICIQQYCAQRLSAS